MIRIVLLPLNTEGSYDAQLKAFYAEYGLQETAGPEEGFTDVIAAEQEDGQYRILKNRFGPIGMLDGKGFKGFLEWIHAPASPTLNTPEVLTSDK